MRRSIAALLLILAAVAASRAQETVVTGTLTYRERIALPATAVVDLTLEDVSRADRPDRVVASTELVGVGQPPIRFSLPYESSRIDASGRYAIRARILDGGRVLFETAHNALVLTQGHGTTATLVLTMAASPGATPARSAAEAPPAPRTAVRQLPAPVRLPNLPATFAGTLPCADCPGIRYELNLFADDSFFLRRTSVGRPGAPVDDLGTWVLSSDRRVVALKGSGEDPLLFAISPNGTLRQLDREGGPIAGASPQELRRVSAFQPLALRTAVRGVYRPSSGNGMFVDCSTGHEWLVEGKPADFDARYRESARRAGEPLLIVADGRLVVETGNDDPLPGLNIVIERLRATEPGGTCPARFAGAPLVNTAWTLTRLGDRPVPSASSATRPMALSLRDESGTFALSAGCNRFTGPYRLEGDELSMRAVGALRSCQTVTDVDIAFRSAIDRVRSFRVLGRTLDLYDADQQFVARFTAH